MESQLCRLGTSLPISGTQVSSKNKEGVNTPSLFTQASSCTKDNLQGSFQACWGFFRFYGILGVFFKVY